MDIYIYNAALYCEDCGETLLANTTKPDYPKPWDSSDYPAGPYPDGGGESDCPEHCDNCHVFLENPLTGDGYEYVRENIQDAINANPVTAEWASYYCFTPTSLEVD